LIESLSVETATVFPPRSFALVIFESGATIKPLAG